MNMSIDVENNTSNAYETNNFAWLEKDMGMWWGWGATINTLYYLILYYIKLLLL